MKKSRGGLPGRVTGRVKSAIVVGENHSGAKKRSGSRKRLLGTRRMRGQIPPNVRKVRSRSRSDRSDVDLDGIQIADDGLSPEVDAEYRSDDEGSSARICDKGSFTYDQEAEAENNDDDEEGEDREMDMDEDLTIMFPGEEEEENSDDKVNDLANQEPETESIGRQCSSKDQEQDAWDSDEFEAFRAPPDATAEDEVISEVISTTVPLANFDIDALLQKQNRELRQRRATNSHRRSYSSHRVVTGNVAKKRKVIAAPMTIREAWGVELKQHLRVNPDFFTSPEARMQLTGSIGQGRTGYAGLKLSAENCSDVKHVYELKFLAKENAGQPVTTYQQFRTVVGQFARFCCVKGAVKVEDLYKRGAP